MVKAAHDARIANEVAKRLIAERLIQVIDRSPSFIADDHDFDARIRPLDVGQRSGGIRFLRCCWPSAGAKRFNIRSKVRGLDDHGSDRVPDRQRRLGHGLVARNLPRRQLPWTPALAEPRVLAARKQVGLCSERTRKHVADTRRRIDLVAAQVVVPDHPLEAPGMIAVEVRDDCRLDARDAELLLETNQTLRDERVRFTLSVRRAEDVNVVTLTATRVDEMPGRVSRSGHRHCRASRRIDHPAGTRRHAHAEFARG